METLGSHNRFCSNNIGTGSRSLTVTALSEAVATITAEVGRVSFPNGVRADREWTWNSNLMWIDEGRRFAVLQPVAYRRHR